MHYYIIGTDHELQKYSSPDAGLRALLDAVIRHYDVVLIAEEVNADDDVVTFGRTLVGDERWLSVDMNERQRKEAGIYNVLKRGGAPEPDPQTGQLERVNAYHWEAEKVREQFWLDGISEWCEARQISHGTIVMTCGMNHRWFLAAKAWLRGHTVEIDKNMPYDYESTWGRLRIV